MATGETGFDDVTFDLISVQYHSLKAGHDYGQYVRDADNAGLDDVAQFFRQVMKEDSERAARCNEMRPSHVASILPPRRRDSPQRRAQRHLPSYTARRASIVRTTPARYEQDSSAAPSSSAPELDYASESPGKSRGASPPIPSDLPHLQRFCCGTHTDSR